MKIFFLLLLFVHCCKSNVENGLKLTMGNLTSSVSEYFPTSNELHQREKRFLTASLLMSIPHLSFEYFWKTFVTRFFISQNMKNYDVTTWPGKFYQKGKYHFANEKSALTALKKTFFLTRTKAEVDNYVFLATATQAAILQMSDRSASYLVEKYKKHTIDVEIKEYIEPSGKFRRTKKPKQLKTFLEEMFLVDLDKKVIPMLKSEEQKEDFKNMVLESLEGENLLLLMNDLRLFEMEKWKCKKERCEDRERERGGKSQATSSHNHHHKNDANNEGEHQRLLKEWLESDGETNHFGTISRLFKDLEDSADYSDGMESKLFIIGQNDGMVHLNEKYMDEHYFHGIKLIFEHIAKRANEKLQSYERKRQRESPRIAEESEIQEDWPSIINNNKLFILNELRKATNFIFLEYADKLNHHESDLIELDEKFFPGKEIVREKMDELEMELETILKELKNNKNYEKLQKSNSANSADSFRAHENIPPIQEDNKKSSKKIKIFSSNFLQTIKKFGGKRKSKGKENAEIMKEEEEIKSDKGKGIDEDNDEEDQKNMKELRKSQENFITVLLEMIDISKYVIKQSEVEEDEWEEQMERNHKQLCNPNSIVKMNLKIMDPKMRSKFKIFCEHLEKIILEKNSMRKLEKANNRSKKAFQKIWQKTESFFHHSNENKFGKFLKEQCEKLEIKIQEDNKKLKMSHLKRMDILKETKEKANQRMEKMVKRECLFENRKLLMILKRYFKLETEGILTIQWPEEDKGKEKINETGTNIRIQRSIGLEFLVVFAMIEPIIETTVLQQIFRQWNFYKWFHGCIRRSWRYKELRCKEPVVIKEERQFAGVVTTTIFEELTNEGVENICQLYKKFVDENLAPLNQIIIKYPSALLKELGIKLSGITKELMDVAWRKINALRCLSNMSLDQLKEIWLKQTYDAKEQRVWDESWAHLAEFLILTTKRQHQWIVSNVFCLNNEKYSSQVECLHRKWKKIGKEADTKRDLKVRVKGKFEMSSPNIEIAHLFELIMMTREDLFGYIFGKLLKNDDIQIDMGLILPIISIGNWQNLKSFLQIYAENKTNNRKRKNDWHQIFISEKFEMAILNKMDIKSKFILKLLKGRFKRIMSNNNGKNEEEEKTKIRILFENCQNYREAGRNNEEKNKIANEIIGEMKEMILSFDKKTIKEMENFEQFCDNFIKIERGNEEVNGTNLEEMMTKTKTQKIFLNKIKQGFAKKLNQIRPSLKNENTKGNRVEKIESNLDRKEELNILIEILTMSGLLGEDSQYKYIAKRLRKSILDTKFKDIRLIIANHFGLNLSKVLENYEGGIEQASKEVGMWKNRGDFENDILKISFGKIYATILKHFATNIGCIQSVEKEGENNEKIDENIDQIKGLIKLLKDTHQLMIRSEDKNKEKSICLPELTPEWIKTKFLHLLNFGGSREIFDEILNTHCYLKIAESFEHLLKETETGTVERKEIVLFKEGTSGTKGNDGKEIENETEENGKGQLITINDDKQIESDYTDDEDESEKHSNETDYYTDDMEEIK